MLQRGRHSPRRTCNSSPRVNGPTAAGGQPSIAAQLHGERRGGLRACAPLRGTRGPGPDAASAVVSVKGVAVRTWLIDLVSAFQDITTKVPNPRQDNSLQAWPWIPETFSWVEPTSWCLLALKKTAAQAPRNGAQARIREADTLLLNRVCTNGGWNYGNAAAFAQDLRPYVPTTAVGLMALQDRPRDPGVTRTLTFLDSARLAEPTRPWG